MDAPTLDYAGLSPEFARLYAQVRSRDRWLHVRLFAQLLIGAAATSIGPLLAAAIACAILHRVGRVDDPPFMLIATAGSLVVVPLLFLLEWRTRGQFFADEMSEQNVGGVDRTSSYGEWELRTTAATYAGWIEVCLWGPRMMIESVDRLRRRARLGRIDARLATELLRWLCRCDTAVAVSQIPDVPPPLRARMLGFLALHDWIDRSSNGRRVWVCEPTRRWLSQTAAS